MSGASEPEEGREGGREGGREAPFSSSAPFLPVGVDPVPNGEGGRQAGRGGGGEVPATTVRGHKKREQTPTRQRREGGRAISSSIKETQSDAITTMTTEKRERGSEGGGWTWAENSWISFLSPIHS